MARLNPALLAILGMVAYKNRDKIGQMINQARTPLPDNSNEYSQGGQGDAQGGLGGLLGGILGGGAGGLGGLLGGGASGGGSSGGVRGGLGDLIDNFTNKGHGDVAKSWVEQGPNQPVQPQQLEDAIGEESIEHLMQQTGLSREELLDRLSRNLPETINRMTPNGRMPTDEEADRLAKPTLLDDWQG